MKLIQKIKSFFGNGVQEGSNRGPWTLWGEFGTPFTDISHLEDGWQRALAPGKVPEIAALYACVMANSRALSQLDPKHKRRLPNNEYEELINSNVTRVLKRPNGYETFSNIMLNTVADMELHGEAIWVGVRDNRNVIAHFHRIPFGLWDLYIDPESKEVFYQIYDGDGILTHLPSYMVPQTDVAHFRRHCPRHPLIGEPPIRHAGLSAGINLALSKSQASFFSNMSRPSGILETEEPLTYDQKQQAREAFARQSASWSQGGVPVLSHGVKYNTLSMSNQDAQVIEAMKLTIQDISSVYGVPLEMINAAQSIGTATETLINNWLSIGLGSLIETVERTLERFFDLGPSHLINLDHAPLLRIDSGTRADTLVKFVQGGILTPAEARMQEGYSTDKNGSDDLYMQQQMVSLDVLKDIHEANIAAKTTPEPVTEPVTEPEPTEENKSFDADYAKHIIRLAIDNTGS